jgi:hypothetical protein
MKIVISLLSAVIFGFMDSLCLLIGEYSLRDQLKKIPALDSTMRELTTGGISAAVALLIATGVVNLLKKNVVYELIEHPMLDVTGILIGLTLVLVGYFIYKQYIKPLIFENNNSSTNTNNNNNKNNKNNNNNNNNNNHN